MRAGLVWRLRAKTIGYQPSVIRPGGQSFGRLVSDSLSVQIHGDSRRCDQPGTEQITCPTTIHLSFHQLEFCDLPFGLAVRPGFAQSGSHGGEVCLDALTERRNQTALTFCDPWSKCRRVSSTQHAMEAFQPGGPGCAGARHGHATEDPADAAHSDCGSERMPPCRQGTPTLARQNDPRSRCDRSPWPPRR
jgi:hypothetical protein